MKFSTINERRVFDLAELRVDGAGAEVSIRGYAAVFDSMSLPLMGFREVIRKGAFKKTLREADVRALWNHDANFVLGRKSAKTLQVSEDEKGLITRIMPPNTTWAADLIESINRRDVTQMSFGFQMVKDRWNPAGADGLPVRELLEVRLLDVSPVTFPAYVQTEVHVRSIMEAIVSRINSGESITTEERAAMAQALESIKSSVLEPGQTHSGESTQEPGPSHSEEYREHIQARRLRLLQLLG